MKSILKNFSLLLFLLILSNISFAQETEAPAGEMNMSLYYIILFIVFFLIINSIFIPLIMDKGTVITEGTVLEIKKNPVIEKIKSRITGLQPIEEEGNLLMDDNYDGIQELNNNVPPWFNVLFYGTVVIAVLYFLNYHVFKIGKLPFQEYYDEVTIAQLQRNELIRTGAYINENTVVLLTDNESLSKGKQVFLTNCVPCHGEGGQGIVGPNLTDDYWIHGGGIKNIFTTIKYGVPAKGMITWMNQFNPKMMEQVASYVISIHGTNPLGGKPPEGNIYVENPDSLNTKTDSLKAKTDSTKTISDPTKKDSLKKDTIKLDSVKAKK